MISVALYLYCLSMRIAMVPLDSPIYPRSVLLPQDAHCECPLFIHVPFYGVRLCIRGILPFPLFDSCPHHELVSPAKPLFNTAGLEQPVVRNAVDVVADAAPRLVAARSPPLLSISFYKIIIIKTRRGWRVGGSDA